MESKARLSRRCVSPIVFAILTMIVGFAPASASDEPFERLPDGRVLIEIFGQKVALPATEPDLDRIAFYPSQAAKTTHGKTIFKLREALADPAKARSAFDKERSWVMIRIVTDWPTDDDKPVLGHFSRGSVPLSSAAEPLTIKIDRAPQSRPPTRGRPPENWPPESVISDEDGYFVRAGVKGPQQNRPSDTGYRLPAAQRLRPTEVDLVVICRWIGATARVCQETSQTRDGRISVSWTWHESTWTTPQGHRYTNYFPKSRWKELDQKLHEVANYLLVNKPAGELE